MAERIFEGLKVVDVASWIAGPVAATILADYGADVVKVEMPSIGDGYRALAAMPGMPVSPINYTRMMDGLQPDRDRGLSGQRRRLMGPRYRLHTTRTHRRNQRLVTSDTFTQGMCKT